MNLKEIITIPGKKGLYKVVYQGTKNIIVESLLDHARIPIDASDQASALNNISIFTSEEDMPLEKVFKLIFQVNNGEKIDLDKIKTAEELKKYMNEILPLYNKSKVYVSDMKKLFSWYNILLESNLMSFGEELTDDMELKEDIAPTEDIEPKEDTSSKEDDIKADIEIHNS
jgi:hypothetical protein